jgi:DNA-binding CsgD family transcriptional regulator
MKMENVELTNRETEMLIKLADGNSYEEIAKNFNIAKETVHKHLVQTYKKLSAKNGVHAVAIAIRTRIIK